MIAPRVRKKIDVNLIPFINVIFLLLIFFMLAGRVEPLDVLDVELPSSESKEQLIQEAVTVFLGADGSIVVNRDLVDIETLPTIIETLFMKEERHVVIKVDARASTDLLIDVLDILRSADGEDVVIETQSILGR